MTAYGFPTTAQYLGAFSWIPLPPGALEKSKSTVQWSYLHTLREMSDGFSDGPPGVVNINDPGE